MGCGMSASEQFIEYCSRLVFAEKTFVFAESWQNYIYVMSNKTKIELAFGEKIKKTHCERCIKNTIPPVKYGGNQIILFDCSNGSDSEDFIGIKEEMGALKHHFIPPKKDLLPSAIQFRFGSRSIFKKSSKQFENHKRII